MKRLVNKAKAQVDRYLKEAARQPEGLEGKSQESPENEVDLSKLTTYPPGKQVYWRPGLYDGENDAVHLGGQCPNFNAAHLKSQNTRIPQPGQQPPGPGQMPPRVRGRRYHDRMHFYHPNGHRHNTQRDLGFSSVLDGRIIWTFGDTLVGVEEACMICATDSTAIGTRDAHMVLMDTALQDNGQSVRSWIDCLPFEEEAGGLAVHAFGGTNIVEVSPNKGVVYFLKNHRPGGVNHIIGAGIATCYIDENNVPHAQRTEEKMWDETEPYWGDVGICLEPCEQHIYVWGHGPAFDKEVSARTYLARVPALQALDINAYEYWRNDTQSWGRQRLGDGTAGTVRTTQEMAVFGWYHMNQGAPFWSNYFNKWMWIHGSGFPQSDVMLMTTDRLEGTWENHGAIASTKPQGHRDGFRYCINGHPEYDDTGKTVFVTWTINNSIWGVTIEWE